MFLEIVDFLKYIFIFLILSFVIGIFLEKIFPKETLETVKEYKFSKLIALFILRICLMSLLIFFSCKLISKSVIAPNGDYELSVNVMLTFALYKTQPSFILMFGEIGRRLGYEVI